MVQYVFFQRVNETLWFIFTVDTEQHTELFVLQNNTAQTLIQQLERGEQDTHTLTNDTAEVTLDFNFNNPLFYASNGQPLNRFIRRLAKSQTSHSV